VTAATGANRSAPTASETPVAACDCSARAVNRFQPAWTQAAASARRNAGSGMLSQRLVSRGSSSRSVAVNLVSIGNCYQYVEPLVVKYIGLVVTSLVPMLADPLIRI
jgi:hypothetical protein